MTYTEHHMHQHNAQITNAKEMVPTSM